MSWRTLDDLEQHAADVEALVDATPGIDPWCSGPDWVVPAHRAFGDDAVPMVLHDPSRGAALLSITATPDGPTIVAGLEPLWGFACPLLGPDPVAAAGLAAEAVAEVDGWTHLAIAGLPLDTDLGGRIAAPLRPLGEVRAAYGIERCVADIGSFDEWWQRRSPRFRRNLRRAERSAAAAGLAFERIDDDAELYERCVAIEAGSWKGRSDDGITSPAMQRFYADMTAALRPRGRLRATVAVLDGRDVGFVIGGIRRERYRGLQLSYTEDAAALSVSHLLQLQTIRSLADEPTPVDHYDLGMDMEYKRRWADEIVPSMTLVVRRRRSPLARLRH